MTRPVVVVCVQCKREMDLADAEIVRSRQGLRWYLHRHGCPPEIKDRR